MAFCEHLCSLPDDQLLAHLQKNPDYSPTEAAALKAKADEIKKQLTDQWKVAAPLIRAALSSQDCSGEGKHSKCRELNNTLKFEAACSFVTDAFDHPAIKLFLDLFAKYLSSTNCGIAWVVTESDLLHYIYFVSRKALAEGSDLSDSQTWLDALLDVKYLGRGRPCRPFTHFKEASKMAALTIKAEKRSMKDSETTSVSSSDNGDPSALPEKATDICRYLAPKYKALIEANTMGQTAPIPGLSRHSSHSARFISVTEGVLIDCLGPVAGLDIANKKIEDSFTASDKEELPFLENNTQLICQLFAASAFYQAIKCKHQSMPIEILGREEVFEGVGYVRSSNLSAAIELPPKQDRNKSETKLPIRSSIIHILNEYKATSMPISELIFKLLERIPQPSTLHSRPLLNTFMVSLSNRF